MKMGRGKNSTGKRHVSGAKIRKRDFAPTEKYSCYASSRLTLYCPAHIKYLDPITNDAEGLKTEGLTLKEPGAESAPPFDIFFCYISVGCYFFALKLLDFFPSSLALDLRPFFIKIGHRVMTRRFVIACGNAGYNEKLIFHWNYTQILLFVFFVFQDTLHYVLSYFFGLFGVRTCVSILWHTSVLKNATFAWKNSEKPWFWGFLVIFVFLTWRHLWRHCDVIQGMFWIFWYQWTREGHSYPLVPHTWCFIYWFPRSQGGRNPPPPLRLWDGSK